MRSMTCLLTLSMFLPATVFAQGSTAGGKGGNRTAAVATTVSTNPRPRPPVTRFSPELGCMAAVAYGCPTYQKGGEDMKRQGWAVHLSFEPWHYKKPDGPAQHNYNNWATFPGKRDGKQGVYLMTSNGVNFCALEPSIDWLRAPVLKCRVLVMDPPLYPVPIGSARGMELRFRTQKLENDLYGRTEITQSEIEWDSTSTSATWVNASSLPQLYWEQARAWDAEARKAYGDALTSCLRNIADKFKEEHDWGLAEYEKLRRFYRRGEMPRSIWRADLYLERRQWVQEHLETYKAAAESGNPEAIEDFEFARYILGERTGSKSHVFMERFNHRFWTAKEELSSARKAIANGSCQATASEHTGFRAELEKLEEFLAPYVMRYSPTLQARGN